MNTLQALLGGERQDVLRRDLPRSVVTHDSLDDLALGNLLEDSLRFRQTAEDAPVVPPEVKAPEAIDFTTASQDEIAEYQKAARAARAAEEEAPPYRAWGDLHSDLYRSLHTHDHPEVVDEVDVGVELHKRIMAKILAQDEHAEARNITRDDDTASAIGTMAMVRRLREVCTDELEVQMRETQELEDERERLEGTQQEIDNILPPGTYPVDAQGNPVPGQPGPATVGGEGGGPTVPVKLSKKAQQQLKELQSRQQAQRERAEQLAQAPTPMGTPALEGIREAAQEGQAAAQAAKGVPKFGAAGLGAGEPTYTSPEQALTIAERWANDPDLRKMAELFGRLDRDIRFKRSKRVVGGNDEIVDIKFGDNLARALPSELALLADDDTEDDFYARYASQELLEFSTVGEENAGRGPILIVLDGSGSMHGERNVWARAVAMCLLHIARLEKRDFALIEFSSGGQMEEWMFKHNEMMPADRVLDMASHFFGGGTTPIIGITRAAQVMKEAPAFSKADVVLVGDGDSGFGPEDERQREQLNALGVRIFGIGIGGSFSYINSYCEPDGYVVDVHDFELSDPSAATAELATHIT